jgi:hypothetical protein
MGGDRPARRRAPVWPASGVRACSPRGCCSAACGGDAAVLETICQALPDRSAPGGCGGHAGRGRAPLQGAQYPRQLRRFRTNTFSDAVMPPLPWSSPRPAALRPRRRRLCRSEASSDAPCPRRAAKKSRGAVYELTPMSASSSRRALPFLIVYLRRRDPRASDLPEARFAARVSLSRAAAPPAQTLFTRRVSTYQLQPRMALRRLARRRYVGVFLHGAAHATSIVRNHAPDHAACMLAGSGPSRRPCRSNGALMWPRIIPGAPARVDRRPPPWRHTSGGAHRSECRRIAIER